MKKQELINAISMVLCRQPHWDIIKSNHAADMMATDIVKMLEERGQVSFQINATLVSVWAGGITVKSPCLYNTYLCDVTEVQSVDISGLNVLDREYLELPDGTEIEREDFTIDGDCDED